MSVTNQLSKLRENIRTFRENKKMTQEMMAERLNVSKTCYAKWERGESQIRIERLVQIAQILEVPLEDLMSSMNEGVLVFQNSNNNFSNSTNFSLALGNPALESEIAHLRYIIDAKNELLDARDREIESLKQNIKSLEKVILALENK
ncbi:putative transcriptional regulator [Canicola haemoglobinophilus]|uniref:Transcriptional regulator n=1 Tax=Canicola haemoglobinophilus TaxID=733 RepID=A0AB38H8N0_9PAST|nr:helix-turn-helix transcriptional regulator [Canicola haemoglobinophilus]STO54099.1 putative transcriptional regulator [Canicola haemoglobinophilus]STO68632.1 putative transcriptional regulator [Canicola haemoglobinophilus]